MNTPPILVAAIQSATTSERRTNLDRTEQLVRDAAGQGARFVCLQELFASPYFCQSEDHRQFAWAEPIPGPTVDWLSGLARDLNIVLVGSLFERRAPGLFITGTKDFTIRAPT